MKEQVEVRSWPDLVNPSLIIGWQEDAGKLGTKVIDYINNHIRSKSFYDVEPVEYFSLTGVVVDNNIAQFPVSRFYAGKRKDLVIFESSQPQHEQYRFLNNILGVAQQNCNIKDIYAVSGTIAPIAHSNSRRLLAVYNQAAIKKNLRSYNLEDMTWEGAPSLNSYLLWVTQKMGIPGISLWLEVPFYLTMAQDPVAAKVALSFFNLKFELNLDFTRLDLEIKDQNEKLAELRREDQQIDRYIRMLEMGINLNENEQLTLVQSVNDFLEKARI